MLTGSKYHVLHFDLRIAGFADLESLYSSLSQQMEQYFMAVAEWKGYEEFEKEGWVFKVCAVASLYNVTGASHLHMSDV